MNLWQYTLQEAKNIHDISAPLHSLGIKGLFYARVYNNGFLIDLSSHAAWADFFLKKFLNSEYSKNEILNHVYLQIGCSLSSLNLDNKIWQEGKEIFGVGNGLTLSMHNENFTETFYYFADKDNYHINELYINKLDFFKNFCIYFKNQAVKIIEKAPQYPIPLLYREINDCGDEKLHLIKKIENEHFSNVKKFYIDTKCYLTAREMECVYWYIAGKTSKETGKFLNISPRTVERHIETFKTRSNCFTKTQIINKIKKAGLIEYFSASHSYLISN